MKENDRFYADKLKLEDFTMLIGFSGMLVAGFLLGLFAKDPFGFLKDIGL